MIKYRHMKTWVHHSLLLLTFSLAPAAAHAGKKVPPQKALTVDAAVIDKAVLCTDGKSHYVMIAPDEHITHRLYYGDGKTFFLVPRDTSGMITGEWFPEPRAYNKSYNSGFRGVDLRRYSRIEPTKDGKGCELACGDRITQLTVVESAKAKGMLDGATFLPSPRKSAPHRLARDDSGMYYYVDRGFVPGTEKSYRLFVGPKGNLKQQKMTNVVSDSEGEIFATKTGSLRLILGKQESSWIEGQKVKKLTLVPVDDNEQMIFNELGVYTGERLGTPCDDF